MPQALAVAGAATSLAGGVFSAVGAQNQYDYQAQIAKNNAIIARQNATAADQSGAQQQQQALLRTASLVGQARAAQGSSGIDVNTGSAVGVRATDSLLGQLSGLEIRSNAARQAYGYQVQAQAFDESAKNDEVAGNNALLGGLIGSLGGAVGSIGNELQVGNIPGGNAAANAGAAAVPKISG